MSVQDERGYYNGIVMKDNHGSKNPRLKEALDDIEVIIRQISEVNEEFFRQIEGILEPESPICDKGGIGEPYRIEAPVIETLKNITSSLRLELSRIKEIKSRLVV
jgi:hypothetical protein